MSDFNSPPVRRHKRFEGRGHSVNEALGNASKRIWTECRCVPDCPNYYKVIEIRGQVGGSGIPAMVVTIEMEDFFEED